VDRSQIEEQKLAMELRNARAKLLKSSREVTLVSALEGSLAEKGAVVMIQ
jgi:hypothetical protein